MTEATSNQSGPIVCGHRGAPAVEVENTLASFAAAVERGATWVEFDVRPTADHQLVIHHDPVTADGVLIASARYQDLDPIIPRFRDLAAAMPGVGFDFEIKADDVGMGSDDYVDLIVSELDTHVQHVDPDQLLVTSFDAAALAGVHQLRPRLRTGFLFHRGDPAEAMTAAVQAGHGTIAPSIRLLDAQLVQQARAFGLGVVTWTVNSPQQVRKAAELGVDMIIGDDPAVIVENL